CTSTCWWCWTTPRSTRRASPSRCTRLPGWSTPSRSPASGTSGRGARRRRRRRRAAFPVPGGRRAACLLGAARAVGPPAAVPARGLAGGRGAAGASPGRVPAGRRGRPARAPAAGAHALGAALPGPHAPVRALPPRRARAAPAGGRSGHGRAHPPRLRAGGRPAQPGPAGGADQGARGGGLRQRGRPGRAGHRHGRPVQGVLDGAVAAELQPGVRPLPPHGHPDDVPEPALGCDPRAGPHRAVRVPGAHPGQGALRGHHGADGLLALLPRLHAGQLQLPEPVQRPADAGPGAAQKPDVPEELRGRRRGPVPDLHGDGGPHGGAGGGGAGARRGPAGRSGPQQAPLRARRGQAAPVRRHPAAGGGLHAGAVGGRGPGPPAHVQRARAAAAGERRRGRGGPGGPPAAHAVHGRLHGAGPGRAPVLARAGEALGPGRRARCCGS
ncbi:unnamed protein product, partial [Heterosigma akashiwo]